MARYYKQKTLTKKLLMNAIFTNVGGFFGYVIGLFVVAFLSLYEKLVGGKTFNFSEEK